MSDQTVTIEVEDPEIVECIGHSIIDDARSLELVRPDQEQFILNLETIGRNLIEESREVRENDNEENFDESLFVE